MLEDDGIDVLGGALAENAAAKWLKDQGR